MSEARLGAGRGPGRLRQGRLHHLQEETARPLPRRRPPLLHHRPGAGVLRGERPRCLNALVHLFILAIAEN